ncbi:DUF1801 domain-containing protein [Phycicoccus sp. CSK15P-2]|uniref:DUF1801 domain-containing protein n=1 Tax=Phycicoccus sp. CSK15P-2 TaxID=2807627 RepID=UPI00194F1A3F|nr:DUF1801 domain-containing protein [Phycicoccus sp. CSK15P-2]MBM6405895.1 DUF1801 domain-containing protein [Phycicoccus sp. CSK15P-2]
MADTDERKTRPTGDDVEAYLAAVADERRRADAEEALRIVREVTGTEPVMWGSTIGFGRQPYRTSDGKDREWFAVGLAARKAALTLYGLTFYGSNAELLERLGPHTTGKGCVYVKRLADLDEAVLRELVAHAWSTNHDPD